MDSFLGLFDPGEETQLPPEPQLGNVEYKLKLVNPSKLRFEHLVTQLKWRLREGHGEAIYEIGVEDSGLLTGLSIADLEDSLATLELMARRLGATTTVLRQRTVDNERSVAEVLVRKVPDDQHSIEVRVAVMGGADAGKSTLLGVLTQGELDNGRGRARLNMFRHLHEIQSGRTSSISHEILGFNSQGEVINYSDLVTAEEICENSTKLVTLMDLAGHRKYLRTTVQGLTGYRPHYGMLVVSGTAGVLGMTREHLALAIALDVPLFVTVTKTDLCPPDDTLRRLHELLESPGCRRVPFVVGSEDDVITASSHQLADNIVPIFLVSSVSGGGLDLLTRFLHLLPPGVSHKEKERLEQEPCEFQIDECFRIPDVGPVVGGLLTRGTVSEGTKLLLGPLDSGEFVEVEVQSVHRNKAPCRAVRASQSATLGLDSAPVSLRSGMVLLSPENTPPTACLFFQATVCVLFHSTAINRGFQTTVHIGNVRQTAVIEGIMAVGGIHTDDKASVLFRFLRHPEYVRIGMRLLFREGETKGIGKITQVFPFQVLAA